jgi:hypothetical protein
VDPDLDRETDAIVRVLDSEGPLDRRALGEHVGARFWGPGRLGRALGAGVAEGRVRRIGRNVYGPAVPVGARDARVPAEDSRVPH